MHELSTTNFTTKKELYDHLTMRTEGLIESGEDFLTSAANLSSLLFYSLSDVNWAGLYLLREKNLFLGPFQGKPACTLIPLGKGVCGTAAQKRETLIVPNVHEFPGHIACDTTSNSEIVVPILLDDELFGVLDIDSTEFDNFDEEDKSGLEKLVKILLRKSSLRKLRQYISEE